MITLDVPSRPASDRRLAPGSRLPSPGRVLAEALDAARWVKALKVVELSLGDTGHGVMTPLIRLAWRRRPGALTRDQGEKALVRTASRIERALQPWLSDCVDAFGAGFLGLHLQYGLGLGRDDLAASEDVDAAAIDAFAREMRDGAARLFGPAAAGLCHFTATSLAAGAAPGLRVDLSTGLLYGGPGAEIRLAAGRIPTFELLRPWLQGATSFGADWYWTADSAHGRAARLTRMGGLVPWL